MYIYVYMYIILLAAPVLFSLVYLFSLHLLAYTTQICGANTVRYSVTFAYYRKEKNKKIYITL